MQLAILAHRGHANTNCMSWLPVMNITQLVNIYKYDVYQDPYSDNIQ